MDPNNIDLKEVFNKKFATYRQIMDEQGEQKAWDTLFQGFPEFQKKQMGSYIDNCTLAEGFSNAISFYNQMGMEMQVVDISNKGKDAVLEIQKKCSALSICKDYGFDKPCRIVCEMDIAATKIAFADSGMNGEILARQADGHCVCVFKYERSKK